MTEAKGYQQAAGQGEGEAARARLSGIKSAAADSNVLTVEYLTALGRIGDGRATKLVIPADYTGLLSLVSAMAETSRDDDDGEIRPRGGLPVPDPAERVDVPAPPVAPTQDQHR